MQNKTLYLLFILLNLVNISISLAQQKAQVLCILRNYPQLSETYQHEEMASVWQEYDITIVSFYEPDQPRKHTLPYHQIPFDPHTEDETVLVLKIGKYIEHIKPHVMHTHWLINAPLLAQLAQHYQIPFTLRTHSFDVLEFCPQRLQDFCQAANSPWCLKVLCFPAFKEKLMQHGLDENKIQCCWPIINYQRFYNPQPRVATGNILNAGPGLWKKGFKYFVNLAKKMKNSALQFYLYVIGYKIDNIRSYNERQGSPVTVYEHVEPEHMPQIYRNHDWLVCMTDPNRNVVGLRMAIAEAQASGIGVCVQVTPERKQEYIDYLGGGGFIVESIDEVPDIISQPYPEKMRLCGLKNAKKCDIETHKHLLTHVWDAYITAHAQ